MQIPTELSNISPFLSRAAELKTREPVIAYYCTFYAAQMAISASSKSSQCQTFLMNLLDDLEKEKSSLMTSYEDIMNNDLVGFAHVSNFAYKVFMAADNEDRSGNSTKKTAKTFLAASIFLEVLSVFGELESDVVEKIKYAKFKAAEIMKAIKAGKTPSPGGPMDSPTNNANEPGNTIDQPIVPEEKTIEPTKETSKVTHSSPVTNITHSSKENTSYGNEEEESSIQPSGLDYKTIQQAQKFAKFAISALQYDDVNNAIENLTNALKLLKN